MRSRGGVFVQLHPESMPVLCICKHCFSLRLPQPSSIVGQENQQERPKKHELRQPESQKSVPKPFGFYPSARRYLGHISKKYAHGSVARQQFARVGGLG